MKKKEDLFAERVALLSVISDEERRMMPITDVYLPSVDTLKECLSLIKKIVFPAYFDERKVDDDIRSYHIGVNLERLYQLLRGQITLALLLNCSSDCEDEANSYAKELTLNFIDHLSEIKRLLYTDVEAMYSDEMFSIGGYSEVIFCYPVVEAMVHYRTANSLYQMNIPVIPRIITEMAHSTTGIDIHPGAKIGEYFSIEHGTGIVIGENCVIGNHVTLYQGVTLGAPIIEDHVTVYSNSTLLGNITIGHDTLIGGNVWVTSSVAPFSRVMQSKAIESSFVGGLGI